MPVSEQLKTHFLFHNKSVNCLKIVVFLNYILCLFITLSSVILIKFLLVFQYPYCSQSVARKHLMWPLNAMMD